MDLVIGVPRTSYPLPYGLISFDSGIGRLSSTTTVFAYPSIAGSIRMQNRCWWFCASAPDETILPHGLVFPGSMFTTLTIPVALVSTVIPIQEISRVFYMNQGVELQNISHEQRQRVKGFLPPAWSSLYAKMYS